MLLRYLLVLAILAPHLAACAGQPASKATIGAMERQHEEQMIRMGGGGGSM
jgi:hypothetical protein